MRRYIRAVKRSIRRSQTGQAILLLAFGFIILLGFVGIVTDLSILYIRFASLRRAVDSAAVAAAGQFSRTVSDAENKERTQFAARQFLEFHGIDAENIIVDTCSSIQTYQNEAERAQNYDPANYGTLTQADFEADWGLLNMYPQFIEDNVTNGTFNEEDEVEWRYRANLHNDVCRPERDGTLSGRKLVRVQASVAVPAPILSTVTGFLVDNVDERATDIVLTAAAVSETASLDVVIVMDVSESMLFDTRYEDYDNLLFHANDDDPNTADTGQRIMRYIPPRMTLVNDEYRFEHTGTVALDTGESLGRGMREGLVEKFLAEYLIGNFDVKSNTDVDGDGFLDPIPWDIDDNNDGTIDSTVDLSYARYYMNGPTPSLIDPGNVDVVGTTSEPFGTPVRTVRELRPECRVRIHPASFLLPVDNVDPGTYENSFGNTLQSEYAELTNATGSSEWDGNAGYQMFQSNYNFYGCCNDPTAGSSIVTTLPETNSDPRLGTIEVCDQDANPNSCFETNDWNFSDLVCQPFKQARDASLRFLYNIDFLAGDRVGFVTFDRGAFALDPDGPSNPAPVMIEQREVAINTLTQSVGVRAEPNFLYYNAFENTGQAFRWDGYSNGIELVDLDGDGEVDDPVPIELQEDAVIDGVPQMNSSAAGTLTRTYLVKDSCAFFNAVLPDGYSLWYDDDNSGNEWGVIGEAMLPQLQNGQWESQLRNFQDPSLLGYQSYELRAQCRGTNFGAALREANTVLTDPTTIRQDGTVWIIVLLSDGAAGATDPIDRAFPDPDASGLGRDQSVDREANPYARIDNNGNGVNEFGEQAAPVSAVYGVYGFCPYGQDPTAPEENIDDGAYDVNGNITEAIGPIGFAVRDNAPSCADADPNTRHACGTDLDGDKFQKNLPAEIDAVRTQVIDDDECAYVYDADDYARDWADFVALRRPNDPNLQLPTIYTIGFNLDYSEPIDPADPDLDTLCEANVVECLGEELLRYIADVGDNNEINRGDYPNATEDRFTELSYGNYWNAPDQQELEEVFDEIASRLFVRLTG